MKKIFTIILSFMLLAMLLTPAQAQKGYEKANEIFRLGLEARFDYQNEAISGVTEPEKSGLKVGYFNLRIDGQITPKFTYSWRQRFNKVNSASDFVNNTDWLYLTYNPTKNWAISAGKQVVMMGGWEYDRAPIDIYFASEYWNNVNCFQLGASVTYTTNKGNDALTLQVCQSPYHKGINNYQTIDGVTKKMADLYAYNLYWLGSHGCYTALHSLNFSEYARGKFDAYVVLGNQFKFGDATIQLDLMNRGVTPRELLFKNFSIMGEVSYLIIKRVNVFLRATYDKVDEDYPAGLFTYPNTEILRLGGGVEYFPLGGQNNKDIRLHAAFAYNVGYNSDPAGTALPNQSLLTVGLTWKMDVIEAATKLVQKHQERQEAKNNQQ